MGASDLDLNLNLLRALDALLTESSVTKAAERLHMTQSAMSHALARLRVALSDPLLVRDGSSMRPTAEAQRLAGEVHEIMTRIRTHIVPSQFDPSSSRRSFVIGIPDAITVRVAMPLLRTMAARAPLSSLHLQNLSADSATELTNGTLDVAISAPGYFPPSLRSAAAFEVRWHAIVAASHPLAGRHFTLAETVGWPHVAAFGSPTNERIDRSLRAQGLRRTVAVVLNTAALVTSVVAESEFVGFVPEHEEVGERIWASDLGAEAPVLEHSLYWSTASEGTAGHEWFVRSVLDSVATNPPVAAAR